MKWKKKKVHREWTGARKREKKKRKKKNRKKREGAASRGKSRRTRKNKRTKDGHEERETQRKRENLFSIWARATWPGRRSNIIERRQRQRAHSRRHSSARTRKRTTQRGAFCSVARWRRAARGDGRRRGGRLPRAQHTVAGGLVCSMMNITWPAWKRLEKAAYPTRAPRSIGSPRSRWRPTRRSSSWPFHCLIQLFFCFF